MLKRKTSLLSWLSISLCLSLVFLIDSLFNHSPSPIQTSSPSPFSHSTFLPCFSSFSLHINPPSSTSLFLTVSSMPLLAPAPHPLSLDDERSIVEAPLIIPFFHNVMGAGERLSVHLLIKIQGSVCVSHLDSSRY